MQPFSKLLIAALLVAASLAARSQQEGESASGTVPVIAMTAPAERVDAQKTARQVLAPGQVGNLRESGMALALSVWYATDKSSCLASVGPTWAPAKGQGVRSPQAFHWAMSEAREGDEGMAPCNRAFETALQSLAQSDAFTLQSLQADAVATRNPPRPKFPRIERSPGRVSHRTAGTLNDTGKQLIADTLGPRWHQVLDHRKYAAHVVLMTGKTLEGRPYCLVEYGLVATPPEGVTSKFPATAGARWRILPDGSGDNCARPLVEAALAQLRDGYPDMLQDVAPEAGMAYPGAAALKKQVARYDAEQAKPSRTQTTSRTRSTTTLRCTNECFNGNCVRTFENGRKERWQAPRVYNPFTRNWEWDITTNACGG